MNFEWDGMDWERGERLLHEQDQWCATQPHESENEIRVIAWRPVGENWIEWIGGERVKSFFKTVILNYGS